MKKVNPYIVWKYKQNLLFSAYLNKYCRSIAHILGAPEEVVCSSEPAIKWKESVLKNIDKITKNYAKGIEKVMNLS